MDSILINVNWVAVIVGAVVAFAFGSLWYSPAMFGKKWMKAVGITKDTKMDCIHAMIAQGVSTFLMAWIIGVTAAVNSLHLAVLVALMTAGFIKANGLWANKGKEAIVIETVYVLVMVLIMVLVHAVV